MGLPVSGSQQIERRGLREQVYDSVLRMLLEGRIASGERLSIETVARMLNVSPTPVREAFVMLERTGLVTRVALRGYRVAPPLDHRQLSELLDARLLLEVDAARRAYAHRDALVPDLRAIEEDHEQQASAIIAYSSGGEPVPIDVTQAYFQSDAEFHRQIFMRAGNRYLIDMYDSLGALTHRMRQTVHRGPEDVREATREHEQILRAFESGDEKDAVEAMRSHIEGVRSRSLRASDS
jgi:DNA-binding GntR family transcriptional regulator